jgi:hypothetical protein
VIGHNVASLADVSGWPDARRSIESASARFRIDGAHVTKIASGVLLFGVTLSAWLPAYRLPAHGEDVFPIAGTYMRDIACTGNGSSRPDLLVRITQGRIESPMGVCSILSHKRNGPSILAHVECKIPGGQLVLGDVTFTIRDDKTLDFEDQDHTSDATLHRCPEQ